MKSGRIGCGLRPGRAMSESSSGTAGLTIDSNARYPGLVRVRRERPPCLAFAPSRPRVLHTRRGLIFSTHKINFTPLGASPSMPGSVSARTAVQAANAYSTSKDDVHATMPSDGLAARALVLNRPRTVAPVLVDSGRLADAVHTPRPRVCQYLRPGPRNPRYFLSTVNPWISGLYHADPPRRMPDSALPENC